METRTITCIECPVGCRLRVDVENCKAVKIEGNKCPKGEKYAINEAEDPVRILTSAVMAEGLSVRMVPVRTNKPVPKDRMLDIMAEIKRIRLKKAVGQGEVIVRDILGTGADLISTREVD